MIKKTDPQKPPEIPLQPNTPETITLPLPETPVFPEEDPGLLPEETPFENPPYEVPPPVEGP